MDSDHAQTKYRRFAIVLWNNTRAVLAVASSFLPFSEFADHILAVLLHLLQRVAHVIPLRIRFRMFRLPMFEDGTLIRPAAGLYLPVITTKETQGPQCACVVEARF